MDWYDTLYADDRLAIHCLPARHYSNRILKRDRTLWASFMIDGPQRIYLSGDGGYDTHFAEIGEKFPGIDLAVMENGQYDRDWRYIHLMPDELGPGDRRSETPNRTYGAQLEVCVVQTPVARAAGQHPQKHRPAGRTDFSRPGSVKKRVFAIRSPRAANGGKDGANRASGFEAGPGLFEKAGARFYPSCSIYKVCRNAERKIPLGFRNRSAQPHPRNILPGAFLS